MITAKFYEAVKQKTDNESERLIISEDKSSFLEKKEKNIKFSHSRNSNKLKFIVINSFE